MISLSFFGPSQEELRLFIYGWIMINGVNIAGSKYLCGIVVSVLLFCFWQYHCVRLMNCAIK